MRKFIKLNLPAFLLLMSALISCDIITNESPLPGKGKVALIVTDAPFPANLVDHVYVTIEKAELRLKGENCKTPEGKVIPDCSEGYILMMAEPIEIDLMQLRNGLNRLLSEAEVPVGKYNMIRLYVNKAEIVLDNETVFPLKIPGGSESGLKILLKEPLIVTENGSEEILLDFDLSRSFIAQGNPKNKKGITGFIFKPVIRAVNMKKSGALAGKITDSMGKPVEEALITLYQNVEVVTTALTNQGGIFKIIGIPEGNYFVTISKEGYKTVEKSEVQIRNKREVIKNVILQRE